MLAIGVDVGGSKASVGVVDTADGRVVERLEVATPPVEETGDAFLNEVADAARGLAARHGGSPIPVGIGICELVDIGGEILSGHRVRWETSDVCRAFAFAKSVAIEADVRAAATAEAEFGAGAGLRHWIYANAGTGIATVLMDGRTPYLGAHGRGVAMGMSLAELRPSGQVSPTVEDIAGGAGMLVRARKAGLTVARIAELIDRANAHHETERAILAEGGHVFGRALALLVNSLDPEAVVVGGGIAAAGAGYVAACREAFDSSVWYARDGVPALLPARFGSESGLIGAALMGVRLDRR
ncbi:ROK family protein [Mesorhizobium sp. IMUNJ 23232]|uniref:ROK family protein n=1 Tax=Mesorhizobium sp. IMUNJ 23232 TaxID=3376064 RepID=UPI003789662B